MTSEADTSTDQEQGRSLREQYTARFAAELESNRNEQTGVRAELERLSGRLQELEKDHDWLTGMREAAQDGEDIAGVPAPEPSPVQEAAPATTAPATTAPDEAPDEAPAAVAETGEAPAPAPRASVPKPRRAREAAKPAKPAKEAGSGAAKAKPAAQSAKAAQPAKAAKAAKSAPAPRQATQVRRPKAAPGAAGEKKVTLRTAVLELLRGHSEPRTAREVADEIARVHPELRTSVPVVRDALNAHVAKGLVEREARQKSVWYTAVAVSGAPAVAGAVSVGAEGRPAATDEAGTAAASGA